MALFHTCLAVKKSDGMYRLPYLFFSSITLLEGKLRAILGTDTLYLGLVLALLLGGERVLERDRLAGDRERLLGDRDLLREDLGRESFSLSSLQSLRFSSALSLLSAPLLSLPPLSSLSFLRPGGDLAGLDGLSCLSLFPPWCPPPLISPPPPLIPPPPPPPPPPP